MQLRVIPTSVHGAIDHVVGPALVAAPEIFRLAKTSPEGIAPRAAGAFAAAYSNLTDYELSPKRLIPMRLHLALDAASGAALAAVPWLTGARKRGSATGCHTPRSARSRSRWHSRPRHSRGGRS